MNCSPRHVAAVLPLPSSYLPSSPSLQASSPFLGRHSALSKDNGVVSSVRLSFIPEYYLALAHPSILFTSCKPFGVSWPGRGPSGSPLSPPISFLLLLFALIFVNLISCCWYLYPPIFTTFGEMWAQTQPSSYADANRG